MLMIAEPGFREVSRRSVLRAGAFCLGGGVLSLGQLLRSRAEARDDGTSGDIGRQSGKSVIMIHLSGGPSHVDMYDMKPEAPREYRGEFQPIATSVPGIQLCELMPMQARVAHKFTILRGVAFAHLHSGHEFYSGYPWQENPRASVPGEARCPALGSVVSRLRQTPNVPPYVSIDNQVQWERAYYLGQQHEPFRIGGDSPRETFENLKHSELIVQSRLDDRWRLSQQLDEMRRRLDSDAELSAVDAFQNKALEIVLSGKACEAFDTTQEPDDVRARYGETPFRVVRQDCAKSYHDQGHPGRALLQARRLVEAGVSVVTYAMGGWDTHRFNFEALRAMLPPLDQAVTALVEDLESRGMHDDVVILMGGEFGRAPRIGDIQPDGRNHWPTAGFLWMTGGGIRPGQAIGATDHRGEQVLGEPIQMQHVLTTLYKILGVDPNQTFTDFNGRPQFVIDDRQLVPGLL